MTNITNQAISCTPFQQKMTQFLRCGLSLWALILILAFQSGCTLLFPFRAPDKEREETRLPPPEQAPVFEDPRFNDLPVRNQLYGSSLAAGHFTHAVNAENNLELAVGIPGADGMNGKHNVGAVILYPKLANGNEAQGNILLTPGPNDDNINIPEETGMMFGFALAHGDFDGNGVDDLAIGCPGFGESLGVVIVRYGGSPPPPPGRLDGPGPLGGGDSVRHFGWSLAAGDFNRDGRDDLVVGEPGDDRPFGTPGRVWVVWGNNAADGRLNMNDVTELHPQAPDEGHYLFGASLAVGNFVTNLSSGLPSLAVGAPNFLRNIDGTLIEHSGKVFVFNPTGGIHFDLTDTLFPDEHWAQYVRSFGAALAAGNFNGDSEGGQELDDLAIGAPDSWIPEHDGIGETLGIPSGEPKTPRAGLVFVSPHANDSLSVSLIVISQDRMGFSNTNDQFGRSLAAGDFNNDDVEDLAIGSPNETMVGSDLSRAKNAGAIYFRFGNPGDWDDGGGIPTVPVLCFDYIDAIRNLDFSNKKDSFGSVLLAAEFDNDDDVDLIVGAPNTDVVEALNAGAVWIGMNQTTDPGVFEGLFVGQSDDDFGEFDVYLNIHNREGAVCGNLLTGRDIVIDEVEIEEICLSVAAIHDDSGQFELDGYKMVDAAGKRVGNLNITVAKQGDDIVNLDIVFDPKKGENIERIVSTTLDGPPQNLICQ